MKGLMITDRLHWHDSWSARMGKSLKIADSSYNLFVFDKELSDKKLKKTLEGIPDDLYRLIDLEPAQEDDCEIMTDSGNCYRKRPASEQARK